MKYGGFVIYSALRYNEHYYCCFGGNVFVTATDINSDQAAWRTPRCAVVVAERARCRWAYPVDGCIISDSFFRLMNN